MYNNHINFSTTTSVTEDHGPTTQTTTQLVHLRDPQDLPPLSGLPCEILPRSSETYGLRKRVIVPLSRWQATKSDNVANFMNLAVFYNLPIYQIFIDYFDRFLHLIL